jgi:hypothetical protein
MTSSPYVPCYETAANGIRGERTRLRRWPIKAQALCRERIPVGRSNACPWPRRSGATCANGGPHSGYRHLADKDEAEVQRLPGPLLALTSGNTSQRLRNPLGRPSTGSRTLTWLPLLVMDVAPSLRTGPVWAPPGSENGPERTIDLFRRPRSPDPYWTAQRRAIGSATARVRRPLRLRLAAAPRSCPAGLTAGRVRWNRDAAPTWPCPPAWWVGRSLATRPRAVTPRERPEGAPTGGDHHRARLGVRQGPPLHVLAQARRPPSVHPSDLRLALPGLPHPRPAVLQSRRPAVSGARHRAAGGGVGPVVAGQGDDEGRPRPRSTRR